MNPAERYKWKHQYRYYLHRTPIWYFRDYMTDLAHQSSLTVKEKRTQILINRVPAIRFYNKLFWTILNNVK